MLPRVMHGNHGTWETFASESDGTDLFSPCMNSFDFTKFHYSTILHLRMLRRYV